MNVVQAQIIGKEFKGKSPDDPKVKAREAEIEIYFEVVWKATEPPSKPPFEYPVGKIPQAIMAWLPSNCFALLHPSKRPQPPRLPLPKPLLIQFRANELEEAMKKQRKFIRKQQAELVVLQQAAKEHHMNRQMVYTAVKMQAMWSESKVPQDQIKDFPELPGIFVPSKTKSSSSSSAKRALDSDDDDDNDSEWRLSTAPKRKVTTGHPRSLN
jgi:hypothetical protein